MADINDKHIPPKIQCDKDVYSNKWELVCSASSILQSMKEFEAGKGVEAKQALKELGIKLGASTSKL